MWGTEKHANAMEACKSGELGKKRTGKAGNREKTERREMTSSIVESYSELHDCWWSHNWISDLHEQKIC